MNQTAEPRPARRPRFLDLSADTAAAAADALDRSLRAPQASIAPTHFYDRLGSALFAAICELPEYYPTRTEAAIVEANLGAIVAAIGPAATLVDLGAGDCAKAARLIAHCRPAQYVAVDVSVDFVAHALERLQRSHPELDVVGVGQDFAARLELPDAVRARRRVFLYPGSSLGNFPPGEAVAFLRRVRAHVDAEGGLLLGVDLAKPAAAVEPAYDDAIGVTAAFDLNVLLNANRLIGADFDPRDWRHVAFLNAAESRIEMHLEARRAVEVRWPGGGRRFEAGERILTEWSHKWRLADVHALLREAGFEPRHEWTEPDPDRAFAVIHAVPPG